MGAEANCTVTVGRTKAEGKALLETDVLVFRGGDLRLSIPFGSISDIAVRGGTLRIVSSGGAASFALGDLAPKWAEKIRNPPTRSDKLGIKKGIRVLLVGVQDVAFERELKDAGALVTKRATGEADLVFYAVDDRASLSRLYDLRKRCARNGGLWIVRPKGSSAISEADVRQAGIANGLVDVKVVRFSSTHTAEKFVVPVSRR